MRAPALGMFLILIMGLALVVAIGVVVVLVVRRRRRVTAPSCGACGYHVAGLEVLRCPECGVDLREAGIVTPGMNVGRRGFAVLMVLLWTILYPLPATYVSVIVQTRVFQSWTTTLELKTTPAGLRSYDEMVITFTGAGTADPGTYDRATIATVRGGVESVAMTVDLDDGDTVVPAAGGLPAEELSFDAGAVLKWMERTGIADGEPDAMRSEAERIVVLVSSLPRQTAFQSDRHFTGGSISSQAARTSPGWYLPTAAAVAFGLWLLVVLLIVRWARRGPAAEAARKA